MKKLDLKGKKAVKELPSVPAEVEEVDLRGTSIRDLTPLAGLRRLRVLNLRGTPVATLAPVLGCKTLQFLWAEKTRLTSVAGIEGLAKLKLLWLHDTKVTSLAPIAALRNLEELDVASLRPESWEFLASLRALRVLDLFDTPFSDVALLQALPALELVRLTKTELEEGSPEVKALDSVLRGRGGGVSFDESPHWGALTRARGEPAPAPAKPPRRAAGVERRYFEREGSGRFFEVFVHAERVLSREGRTYAASSAKVKLTRFKSAEKARAHADKLCKERARMKIYDGSYVPLPEAAPTIPAPDLSELLAP